MRPPDNPLENPEQVLILDELPELDVIRDALDDGAFMKSRVTPYLAGDLPTRFRQETMHQPMGTDRSDETMAWNLGAEFAITLQNVQFSYAAAQRIIEQRGPIHWIVNRYTKRKEAARDIAAALAPIIAKTTGHVTEE